MKQAGVAEWKWSVGPDKASLDRRMVPVIRKKVQPADTGGMTGQGVLPVLRRCPPLKCHFGAAIH
ncbi:hypothetical protein ACS72_15905 [Acinetobacter sp. VT 511]|nr:hypothetical protein ACS72_15905 [Acinetobacter sp. VT 511]